ncbi:MAG: flagellar export protein FliJ [Limisphaerales bacterium]|nr:flagellar export protein FliJ [Verrucomicrobiae bacterium]HAQ98274.1 flagellar export protein FliJ [Verrucomicrobiales bacterium]HBP56554.1 flagellar export protein FliJ [Verrucomicrobiales bacterium]HCP37984.1 flagellar export protein FliJ [Verrucomicrobiales bacterium]|tara:strand:- start:283 stop:726 length:444 start_codon:yes stop_codon:yes gene_type:complete
MKRFEFKLDGVLQLRNQHERTVIDKHAVALNRFNQLAEKMKTLREGLTMQQQRYQQSLSQPQSVSMMQNLRKGCEYYEQRIDETLHALNNAEQDLEQCKNALTAARQECEVMEKYRDRLAGAHAKIIDKADQTFLDELSLRGAHQFS